MDASRAAPSAPAALKAVVAELELHSENLGWDRPPALYALVDTAELAAAEPGLAERLGLVEEQILPGSLTPVEQEPLGDRPLDEALASITWPGAVRGCALVHEVLVLPPGAEDGMPADADPVEWADGHDGRQEMRMTVAVLRGGARASALRLRSAPGEDARETAFGDDLAPNLSRALLSTLDD
jgi:hypothetical protein